MAVVDTPRRRGFRMPAEWEPHAATWLAWPHERSDWPGKFEPVAWVYGDFVRHLSRVERVCIFVENDALAEKARRICQRAGAEMTQVEFIVQATNRSWTRDSCAIFVKSRGGEVGITDWHFNGWAKYENWQADDALPGVMAGHLSMRAWTPEFDGRRVVLEGGSIDVNGRGSLLTTEECLLSPVQARNPELSRADVERVLRNYLAATNVLWLRNGIAGDDTHGHVDDLARFVNPTTIVVASEDDRSDANYEPLKENYQILKLMADERERPLNIVKLPMPRPIYFDSQRLPASYANFYIANQLVLVPTFNDPADRLALNTLARLFPDREVRGIHCLDLVLGLGTLHCMTQQQPL
ncbi:MAG: agmatine deiminase family protein [Bryobacteraceae bacterium]|nr:agmatine deiminase family protein [Bryobacteraceae bacterium]